MVVGPWHLLVTRPSGFGEPLAQKIQALGGRATLYPTLEIHPVPQEQQDRFLPTLKSAKLCIFVSPNAAAHLAPSVVAAIKVRQNDAPNALSIISMGVGTTKVLEAKGLNVLYTPEEGTVSETLLQLPWLQREAVQNTHSILFTGQGGRALIQETLLKRGADVTRCEVYQSTCPLGEGDKALQEWKENKVNVVLVTSKNSLGNLLQMLGETGKSWVSKQYFLVVSHRLAEYVRQLGFENIIIAQSARDEAIIQALGRISEV